MLAKSIIDEEDLDLAKKIFQFLGAVHDIGKATPAFQSKTGYQNSIDLDHFLKRQIEEAGFVDFESLNLPSASISPHALAGQFLLEGFGINQGVASVVGGHHGRPINNNVELEKQYSYLKNYYQTENVNEEVYHLWKMVQEDILQWALDLSGFKMVADIPEISQPGQVLFSGLLIMADWIASNEHYFPLILIEDEIEIDQESRLENGWSRWFKTRPLENLRSQSADLVYDDRFSSGDLKFVPREVQRVMYEVIESTSNPGLFILEAPMGVGKTEAALIGSEQLMRKTNRSGLFFGLPTQATSNGIFQRIVDWLGNYAESVGEAASIQLVHGKASLNKDFSHLKQQVASHINIDGQEARGSETVLVNQWFNGRKTSALDDFVVGTVDQFLLAALKQKHLGLRHLGFSKKVVIIDEVHAYDAYMNQYLLEAIKWMGAYEVPIIILSATLSAKQRQELVENYLAGKDLELEEISFPEAINSDRYPLITYTDGLSIKIEQQFNHSENKTVRVEQANAEILETLLDGFMKNEGIIGVVVNTVKRAQELAKQCIGKYGEDKVSVLHSSFIATDRARKEEELLNEVGKNAKRPLQKIIIGTQVIEQSLDIDFDVMVSDLAPMDLLIQRMGRLHRHEIKRPSYYQEPVFFVLTEKNDLEFESGSAHIYGEYILARTKYYLPTELNMPEDISKLVQLVYNDIKIDDDKLDKDQMEIFRIAHEEKLVKKRRKANYFKLDDPVYEAGIFDDISLVGWLENTHPNTSEEYAYAQVRDTEETIEVIAVKKYEDGYSLFNKKEDLSTKINDYEVGRLLNQATVKLPPLLSKKYNIDQTIQEIEIYNQKYLSTWQSQPWLKGKLGIIFDSEHNFEINGIRLHYDEIYGMSYEGIEVNESI